MGFFQDLKEDLSLAMNELLPNDDMEEIAVSKEKKTNFKEIDADKVDKALHDTAKDTDSDAETFARELIDAALQPQEPKVTETLTVEQLVAAVEQSVSKEVSDMIEDEMPAKDGVMQNSEEMLDVVMEEPEMSEEQPEEVITEASVDDAILDEAEVLEDVIAKENEVSTDDVADAADVVEVFVEDSEEPEEETITKALKETAEEEIVEETEGSEESKKEETMEESREPGAMIMEEVKEPEEEVTMEEPETIEKTEEIQEEVKTVPAEEPEVKEMFIRNDNSFEKEVYEEIMKEDTGKEKAMKNELEKAVDEVVGERVESVMSQDVLDETAIVTKGMKVNGDISSQGSLDVLGSIKGNIEVLGKLNVAGEIEGNSNAAEVFADAAHITGEIHATGTVKVGINSVIIGNIFATSAVIAGAVKGDIDVHGPVVLDSSAIVMGNIKSKSVQMNNGAVIEGLCSQCYADVSPASFFKDIK